MLTRRISSRSLRCVIGALVLTAAAWPQKTLHAQELPAAPSFLVLDSNPAGNSTPTATLLFGTHSLFLTAPGATHPSLFLMGVPQTGFHPASPLLFSGGQSRPASVNPFALFNESPASTSSSFVLGGFNMNAGLVHGRQAPLSGFSLSTKTSGMDFSVSGGLSSGGGFNTGGFGPGYESFGNRGTNNVAPNGSPQLSLRLKF